MSWQEDIQKQIVIITGDRKRYEPKWLKPLYKISYNVSSFNFPNVKGTLVKKFQPQGAKYPLEIYFDGEDHLQTAEAFRKSSEDTRHWHILHPLYGDIRVQPSEFTYDNTKYNLTKITGVMLETLANNFPNNEIDSKDSIAIKKENTDTIIAIAFKTDLPTPVATDIIALNGSVDLIEQENQILISTDEDSNNFNALVGAAKRELVLANFDSINAITAIQEMINYPSTVAKSVDIRLKAFVSQLERLDETIRSIQDVPKSLKVQFESISATVLGALGLIISNKESDDDYQTTKKVLEVVDLVIATYDQYNETLDFLQSDNAQELDSFIPNYEQQISLNDLINFGVANLFEIAMNSKQERSFFLEEDSNLVILTHRFLGLDADDLNIDEFIRNNEIGLSEHLVIKKGRKITVFV